MSSFQNDHVSSNMTKLKNFSFLKTPKQTPDTYERMDVCYYYYFLKKKKN